jgi:hypothetical protein
MLLFLKRFIFKAEKIVDQKNKNYKNSFKNFRLIRKC